MKCFTNANLSNSLEKFSPKQNFVLYSNTVHSITRGVYITDYAS